MLIHLFSLNKHSCRAVILYFCDGKSCLVGDPEWTVSLVLPTLGGRRPCSLLPPVVTVGRCRCLGSTSCAYWAENSWMSDTGSVQQEPELGLLETASGGRSQARRWYLFMFVTKSELYPDFFASAHRFISVFPAATITTFPALKACHCFFPLNLIKAIRQITEANRRLYRSHINVATHPLWTVKSCDGGNLLL